MKSVVNDGAVSPVTASDIQNFVKKQSAAQSAQTVGFGPDSHETFSLFDSLDLEESLETAETPEAYSTRASVALKFVAAYSARAAAPPKLDRPGIGGRSASPYALDRSPHSARSTLPNLDRDELQQSQMMNDLIATMSDDEYEEQQLVMGSKHLSDTIITSQRDCFRAASAVNKDAVDYGHLIDTVNVVSSDDEEELLTPRPDTAETKESDDKECALDHAQNEEKEVGTEEISSAAPKIQAVTSVASDVWLEQMFTQIVDDLSHRSDSE